MTNIGRFCALGIGLLILVGCGRSEGVGESFVLRAGETVRLRGTDLRIEVQQIIDGLDGSQMIGDGSVTLRVTVEGEVEMEVYLESGDTSSVGEYDIRFERVTSGQALGCELVVVRR